jgi:hypothetical protein
MPTNEIKKDAREGKGSVPSLEKKWDKAKDASKKSTGESDDWALTNYIYQKERDASVVHTATMRLLGGFPKSKRPQWMAEYEKELVRLKPELRGKVDWDTAAYFFLSGVPPKEAAQKHATGSK